MQVLHPNQDCNPISSNVTSGMEFAIMLANLCHDDYSVIVKVKIAIDVLATAEQHSMNQDGIGES